MHLRLLVIDDSEDDFLIAWQTLRRSGIRAQGSRVDSADALRAALEEQRWDLCLLDWVMPTLTAPEAVRILSEFQQQLPCIVWSGRDDEKVAFVAREVLGAVGFLGKGRMEQLPDLVRQALQGRSEVV